MKKLIYIILSALILSVACHKEDVNKNPLSGKIKTVYQYDSLNTLINTSNYIYDDSNKLYKINSDVYNLTFWRNDDTVYVRSSVYNISDSIITYYYGLLGQSGKITLIETTNGNSTIRNFYASYQVSSADILEQIDYNSNVLGYAKVFNLNYDGSNYINYNLITKLTIPPTEYIDTSNYNITYTNIPNNYGFYYYFTAIDLTPFSAFGYYSGKLNTNMPDSIINSKSGQITNFRYTTNLLNQIIEVERFDEGRLFNKFKIVYN